MATLVVQGCAGYEPKPLAGGEVDALLESPDRVALARQAGQLQHPLLAPITIDFAKPLTGDEIAVLAVLANPDLRALRARQHVADAQVFASGLLPDPQISLGIDKVVSSNDPTLVSGYANSLSLDILSGLATRHADMKQAKAAAEQVRLDIAWQEWTLAGHAKVLALRAQYLAKIATLAGAAADSADLALSRAMTAAARGDLKGDVIEVRRVAAADARDRALTAGRDALATRMELNATLGMKPDESLSLAAAPSMTAWAGHEPGQLFDMARTKRLDLAALAAGYESQEATVLRAVLGQYPRLGITLNQARDTGNIITRGPAVSFDLPLWNRNRGAIATANADRDRLRAEYAARLHQARAEIAALVAALDHDERARALLEAQLPELIRIADAIVGAVAQGDLSEPAGLDARSAAVDKQIALLGLAQLCAEQRIALALAVGLPIIEGTELP